MRWDTLEVKPGAKRAPFHYWIEAVGGGACNGAVHTLLNTSNHVPVCNILAAVITKYFLKPSCLRCAGCLTHNKMLWSGSPTLISYIIITAMFVSISCLMYLFIKYYVSTFCCGTICFPSVTPSADHPNLPTVRSNQLSPCNDYIQVYERVMKSNMMVCYVTDTCEEGKWRVM